jgi:hypothetical protein
MARHSKFKNIMHRKGAKQAKPIFVGLALMLSVEANLLAQESLPDPNTIVAPNVELPNEPSARAKTLQEGYKFFYFHNPNVTFSEAYSDLSQCRAHLEVGAITMLPAFIPYGEPVRKEIQYRPSPYGLVGETMAAIIAPKLERGLRNNKLRRCMGTRGYARYAVQEKIWEQLNEGDEAKLILEQAKLASGPKPNAPEVTR